MRVAVTGRAGQLVSCLLDRGSAAGHQILALGRPELDLADPVTTVAALTAAMPDVIVSAAAYTAVDKAEDEPELAHRINADGAGAVAEAARQLGVPLIHISTDYVFKGHLDRPYVETDLAEPNGVYGASKLAGEQRVLSTYADNSAILRVAWVYSPFGANFAKTMLRLAGQRDEISVVADQIGNPSGALDIADGVLQVAANLVSSPNPDLRGVFHMAARGEASWADFAETIFSESAARGGPSATVNRITTSEYPTRAMRPANSRLNSRKIAERHDVQMPEWADPVGDVVARILSSTH